MFDEATAIAEKMVPTLPQALKRKAELEAQLAAIEEQIRPAIAPIKAELGEIEKFVDEKIHIASAAAFEAAKQETGTVNFEIEGIKVKSVIGKKVTWDQDLLLQIRAKIMASGDNASQYIEEKLNVQEKKYSAWPDSIKAVFTPARTVTPEKPKITIDLDGIPF